MSEQDDNLDKVADGQQARIIRSITEEWLISQEEDILDRLIAHHKQDTLTDTLLRGSIGEIAGLRDFRRYLETKVRQGVAAAEIELGDK
tara:strand:+ start:574 stop:840 length:267 start_codon:yes stop_codon:yes gene_type:complete